MNHQINRQTVTVLVVDDERDRDKVYTDFFGRLSTHRVGQYAIKLELPKAPADAIRSLVAREPSFVVLDMRLLGNWGAQKSNIYRAIRNLKCPIGLLSLDFNDPVVSESATNVLSELKDIPKLAFIPYDKSIRRHCFDIHDRSVPDPLPDDDVSVWNLILSEALGHATSWKPAVVGSVTFLHLTDTHFGTKVQPDFLNAVAINTGSSRTTDQPIDSLSAEYLIWTGDITDNGLPGQFKLATRFYEELVVAGVLPQSHPVSIVPGNHDLCRPLALASRLSHDPIDPPPSTECTKSDSDEPPKIWNVKETSVTAELWEYGIQPYRDFYFDLMKERPPSVEVGHRWLPQWANLGFAILELPLEAHVVRTSTVGLMPEPFVSPKTFKQVTNLAIKSFVDSKLEKNVCIIVLIHGRTPDQPESGAKRWTELIARIAEHGNPVIVIGGHEHVVTHATSGRRLTIIGVPHDQSKTSGSLTLPGVGYIRLSGLGTNKLRCEITKLEKRDGTDGAPSWVLQPPARFELTNASPHNWNGVTNFSA